MWGIEREEFLQIGEWGRRRDGEGDVARGRRRGERRLSDGVGLSFIKVSNCTSCVRQVFFWFPGILDRKSVV